MLRGLWRLAWLEIKIFLREPLGAIGGVAVPVIAFVIMSRVGGPRLADNPSVPRFMSAGVTGSTSTIAIAFMAMRRACSRFSASLSAGLQLQACATP